MDLWLQITLIFIGSYLIGSIPTGYIWGKALKGIDIREHGSGNVGATNVFRTLGKVPGILCLILDACKGLIPVLAAKSLGLPYWAFILTGILAIIGHIWTIFLGFRGGKGVATALGVFAALDPIAISIALAVFIILVAVTRYVSVGSIFGSLTFLTAVLIQWFLGRDGVGLFLVIMTAIVVFLIIFKHRTNIKRLLNGTEGKI
jgi:glycerol-3-phosphate acyltransferase PlsY